MCREREYSEMGFLVRRGAIKMPGKKTSAQNAQEKDRDFLSTDETLKTPGKKTSRENDRNKTGNLTGRVPILTGKTTHFAQKTNLYVWTYNSSWRTFFLLMYV